MAIRDSSCCLNDCHFATKFCNPTDFLWNQIPSPEGGKTQEVVTCLGRLAVKKKFCKHLPPQLFTLFLLSFMCVPVHICVGTPYRSTYTRYLCRRCWISWCWSYRQLWGTWLGTELGSSGKATSAHNPLWVQCDQLPQTPAAMMDCILKLWARIKPFILKKLINVPLFYEPTDFINTCPLGPSDSRNLTGSYFMQLSYPVAATQSAFHSANLGEYLLCLPEFVGRASSAEISLRQHATQSENRDCPLSSSTADTLWLTRKVCFNLQINQCLLGDWVHRHAQNSGFFFFWSSSNTALL